jgi:hypothetical protein
VVSGVVERDLAQLAADAQKGLKVCQEPGGVGLLSGEVHVRDDRQESVFDGGELDQVGLIELLGDELGDRVVSECGGWRGRGRGVKGECPLVLFWEVVNRLEWAAENGFLRALAKAYDDGLKIFEISPCLGPLLVARLERHEEVIAAARRAEGIKHGLTVEPGIKHGLAV